MHARDSTGLGTTGVYPLLPNPFLVSRNLSSWWPRIKLRGGGGGGGGGGPMLNRRKTADQFEQRKSTPWHSLEKQG